MKTPLFGLTLAVCFCTVGCSLAQDASRSLPNPIPPIPSGSFTHPMPPAMKAAFIQAAKLINASRAEIDAGQFAQAEADARLSVALCPGLGAQAQLAQALYCQGKDAQALQVYQQIADAGANAGYNEWPYTLLLLKAGQWPQAVEAYNTALRLGGDVDVLRANSDFSPDMPQPTDLEAAIHIGMGITQDGGDFHGTYQERMQQALTHFQQALTLEPDSPLVNYYYGYGLRRTGRRTEAQAAFQKAAALDRDGDVKAAAEDALAGR